MRASGSTVAFFLLRFTRTAHQALGAKGIDMSAAKMLRILLVSSVMAAVCLTATACSPEKTTAARLHGTWYEDVTGQTYEFISDTQLVLPVADANGSNAVTYSVIGSDKISITQGQLIHVIYLTKLDGEELDTRDASAATTNRYFRKLEDTAWAKNRTVVEQGALPALKNFPNIVPDSSITWLSAEPTDTADVWKAWPTSSIQRYAKAWDWAGITRNDTVALAASGTVGSEGFAIDFTRVVPTTQQLAAFESSSGLKVVSGGPYISVGYAGSMKSYPAGAFVYLNGRLLYSLGGGYAVDVQAGPTKNYGFVPGTHQ